MKSQPTTVFLGGPARTGKTWIAQQVSNRAAREGWQTVTLSPTKGNLPGRIQLRDAIQLYQWDDRTGPTLVVLDDLEGDPGRGDFEEDVQDIRLKGLKGTEPELARIGSRVQPC